jgi:hypothetical protein
MMRSRARPAMHRDAERLVERRYRSRRGPAPTWHCCAGPCQGRRAAEVVIPCPALPGPAFDDALVRFPQNSRDADSHHPLARPRGSPCG